MRTAPLLLACCLVPTLQALIAAEPAAAPATAPASDGLRTSLDLGGTWEAVPTTQDLPWPLPAEGWKPHAVPQHKTPLIDDPGPYGYPKPAEVLAADGRGPRNPDKQAAWFRRSFPLAGGVPAGMRALLHCDGVAWRSAVRVNGSEVGTSILGAAPTTYDITAALRAGANELAIGCTGKAGLWDAERKTYIAPTPAVQPGIWGAVRLELVPAARIDDVWVRTSVAKKRLEVALELVNQGAAPATLTPTATVSSAEGGLLLSLAGEPQALAAGERRSVVLAADWIAPHQWTPATPVCYRAEAELRAGTVPLDRVGTDFGFREFTIKGKDFLLNGRRQVLLRNSWLTNPAAPPEVVYEQMRGDIPHFNTLRLHLGFINPHTIAQADRAGMMIIPEFWAWFENSDKCWPAAQGEAWLPAAQETMRRLVRRYRNHPSVVMWSLANETMWNDTRPEWMKLAHRLVDTVRAADPDRPLQADAEITWAGKLETISIHYPEGETGTVGRQYVNSGWVLPNDLAWLKHEGVNRSWRAEFAWDRPLMIGEYYAMDDFEPEHGSAYMGDEAFDQGRWRWATIGGRGCMMPHADNGGYQLNARISSDHYRAAGVACLNPWTGQGLDIIPPLLARPLDYHPNAFGGGELKRRFLVANDTGRAWNAMHLQAGLLVDGRTVWSEEKIPAQANPGDRREVAVAIRPPAVAAPTRARLVVRLRYDEWSGARELYRHEEDLWIMPRASLAGLDPAAVALVDGADGATAKALAGLGLTLTAGSAGDAELSSKRMLVVGEGAAGSADLAAAARFAEGGGQVLVLHQDACDPFIPGQPEIDPRHAASMSWRHARHPALDGLDDGQLRWWLPDHLVADHSLVRSAGGPALPASTSGGSFGMHWSPLTSVRHGKGQVTFCQYRLADRATLEPAAGWILAQAVRSALAAAPAAPAPALRLVGAVPKNTREALAAASVAVGDGLDGDGPALVDARFAPDATAIARLRAQLESGATVWLRGLDEKTLPAVAGLLPWTPAFAPLAKDAVAAARRSDHPLIAGIATADLYWARGGGSRRKSTAPLGGPAVVPPSLHAATVLTEPGLVVAVPVGKGTVLIDQLNWDGGLSAELERATRLAAGLARNCGAGFRIAAAKRYRYAHLDLAAGANRGYVDEVADDGTGGWTDQGANDMRYFLINHLGTAGEGGAAVAVAPFPTEVSLAGVPFRLVDPKANQGRAVVSLRGQGHGEKAPAEVRGLPAGGARANRVWFLHAAGWGPTGGYLTEVARYEVVYADGSRASVPVRWGRDIGDWWNPLPLAGAQIAWSGRNEKHAPVGIYAMPWDNPSPDKAIAAIDVVGALAETQLVLLGATLGLEDEQGVRTVAAWECGGFADGRVQPGAGGQPLTGAGTPTTLTNRTGLRLAGGQALGARLGAGPLADGTPLAIEIEVAPEGMPGGYFGGLVEAGSYLQSGVRLLLRHDLKVVVEHFAGPGKEHATYLESREPLPLGRFATVRYEHDGKRARLLIDGQPVAVADCPPPAPWRGDLRVGSAGGKDYFLNGVVAGVRLLALAPGK